MKVDGMEFSALPPDRIPAESLMIVKTMRTTDVAPTESPFDLTLRSTSGLTVWEAIGMLECALTTLKDQYRRQTT